MATPFLKVYEAFLARITADEWTVEEDMCIVERDWQQLLDMAIFRFKYPRVSLEKEYYDPNPDDDCDKTLKNFTRYITENILQNVKSRKVRTSYIRT